MYITKISLNNVRCYKEVIIDLDKKHDVYSLMVAGNNGSGKSAILRAIAMGLCDQASAGSLLRELLGDFIRKEIGNTDKRRKAILTIDLKDHEGKTGYQIKTVLKINDEIGFEVVDQYLKTPDNPAAEQEDFPFNQIFVTAYGAGLRTEGTEDYGQYFAADSVYSLFKYSQPLQNPEISWRRLVEASGGDEQNIRKSIEEKLLTILNLTENPGLNKITLKNNGIYVTSDWGTHELSALGDGYRALTNMLMDIYSWLLLMKNHKAILAELDDLEPREWEPLDFDEDFRGIIIIDEIEKHLHPKLQRLVIDKFKEIFPCIQFILSSHSALCVAGTADIEDEFKIYITRKKEDAGHEAILWDDATDGMRTDQILDTIFNVPYINQATVNKLREYSSLYLNKDNLTELEVIKLNDLRKELSENSGNTFLKLENKLIDSILEGGPITIIKEDSLEIKQLIFYKYLNFIRHAYFKLINILSSMKKPK